MIDRGLFEAARQERERRATARGVSVAQGMATYSLSGLGTCAACGGRLRIQPGNGTPRLYCANRRQGKGCAARGAKLADLERELDTFLRTFIIPTGYHQRLQLFALEASKQAYVEAAVRRGRLERQLARAKDLYQLGDLERAAYLAVRERVGRDLAALDAEQAAGRERLAGIAAMLADAMRGWERATQAQRNRLARLLFAEVVVRDGAVVTVKPHPEVAGLFALDAQAHGADLATFDRADAIPVTSASTDVTRQNRVTFFLVLRA